MSDKHTAFELHVFSCDKCKTVDPSSTASLVNCCLIGAPLLRDHLVAMSAPEKRRKAAALKRQFTVDPTDGKNYQTTARKVKEATKYKTGLDL